MFIFLIMGYFKHKVAQDCKELSYVPSAEIEWMLVLYHIVNSKKTKNKSKNANTARTALTLPTLVSMFLNCNVSFLVIFL